MVNPYISTTKNYTENPDTSMFYMHTHENHEIFCFLKGNADYYVEGNIYPLHPGDILLMKKGEAHSLLIKSQEPYERIVMYFNSEALLGECNEKIISFINNKPLGKNNRFKNTNSIYYLDKICGCQDFSEQRLYLTVLLNEFCSNNYKTNSDDICMDSVTDIITYINEHLTENIALETICENFYLSKTNLMRKFKEATGSTIWNYILTKRLILANELMQNGMSPTLVYSKCGFKDYSTFFRAYKKLYNISPSKYLKL